MNIGCFPGGPDGKVSVWFNPWVRKIPRRRKWQPTPVLLPGQFHGWRSLVGYSPWDHKESDTTERLHFSLLMGMLYKERENSICIAEWLFSIIMSVLIPVHTKLLQSCLILCDLPGSSVHGILQARTLEWAAIPSSRGFSQPRDQTLITCLLHWQVGSLPLVPPGKSLMPVPPERSNFFFFRLSFFAKEWNMVHPFSPTVSQGVLNFFIKNLNFVLFSCTVGVSL